MSTDIQNKKLRHAKARERIESKKRKAVAFLALAHMNEADDTSSGIARMGKGTKSSRVSRETDKLESDSSEDSSNDRSNQIKTNDSTDKMNQNKQKMKQKNDTENKHLVKTGTISGSKDVKCLDDESSVLEKMKLDELNKEIKARQKAAMAKPKFYLCLNEVKSGEAQCSEQDHVTPQHEQPPLFMLDLQHMLLYSLQGDKVSFKPRWCKLLRWTKISHVVFVSVKGLSITEYKRYPQCFPNLSSNFGTSVEIMAPCQYGSSVFTEIFNVPLSFSQMKHYRLSNDNKDKESVDKDDQKPKWNCSSPCSRLDLLLSMPQMMKEGYPMPVDNQRFSNYVYSKHDYEEVSEKSPMFAVDCEMCLTTIQKLELTRVTVVNENSECVYDTLVKPHNRIINYLTRYSGITREMLTNVKTRLQDVQKKIQKLLPADVILCGQSLNSDLNALQMFHPYVIDTSVIYNLSGSRSHKPGLKLLASVFLGHNIQDNIEGHDSREDSETCMKLVKLKLENGVEFGDVVTAGPQSNVGNSQDKTDAEKRSHDDVASEISGEDARAKKSKTDKELSCEQSNASVDEESDPHTDTDEETVAPSGVKVSGKTEIEKRNVFFQNRGSMMYQSFFDIVKEEGFKASVVQKQELLNKYDYKNADTVACGTDKEAVAQTRSLMKEKKILFANLHRFSEKCQSDDENIEANLQKIDKYIGKIHKSAEDNTLMVVVLSGRVTEDSCHNAMSFIKIV